MEDMAENIHMFSKVVSSAYFWSNGLPSSPVGLQPQPIIPISVNKLGITNSEKERKEVMEEKIIEMSGICFGPFRG